MSLISILLNVPVPQSLVPPRGDYKLTPARLKVWNRNMAKANEAKRQQSIARYRAVMGDRWMTARAIENALGYSRSHVGVILGKWEKMGLVKRRPFGGREYVKTRGYEWRWIK